MYAFGVFVACNLSIVVGLRAYWRFASMQLPLTFVSHWAAGGSQNRTMTMMAIIFMQTMTKQILQRNTACHGFVVTPMSRKRKVRTESFPKVVQTMDQAGAMIVYLIASDLSDALAMSAVCLPSP